MVATGVLTLVLLLAIGLTWKQLGKAALILGLVTGMAVGAMVADPVMNVAERVLGAGIQVTSQIGR